MLNNVFNISDAYAFSTSTNNLQHPQYEYRYWLKKITNSFIHAKDVFYDGLRPLYNWVSW